MSYDASADTLVCELRFPVAFGLLVAGSLAAGAAALSLMPVPVWLRGLLVALLAGYAAVALWRWWQGMPARLVVTGDGRCRGLAVNGDVTRYGTIRDAVVWRAFVVISVDEGGRRHLFITRGMVPAGEFRRLRVRLTTLMPP